MIEQKIYDAICKFKLDALKKIVTENNFQLQNANLALLMLLNSECVRTGAVTKEVLEPIYDYLVAHNASLIYEERGKECNVVATMFENRNFHSAIFLLAEKDVHVDQMILSEVLRLLPSESYISSSVTNLFDFIMKNQKNNQYEAKLARQLVVKMLIEFGFGVSTPLDYYLSEKMKITLTSLLDQSLDGCSEPLKAIYRNYRFNIQLINCLEDNSLYSDIARMLSAEEVYFNPYALNEFTEYLAEKMQSGSLNISYAGIFEQLCDEMTLSTSQKIIKDHQIVRQIMAEVFKSLSKDIQDNVSVTQEQFIGKITISIDAFDASGCSDKLNGSLKFLNENNVLEIQKKPSCSSSSAENEATPCTFVPTDADNFANNTASSSSSSPVSVTTDASFSDKTRSSDNEQSTLLPVNASASPVLTKDKIIARYAELKKESNQIIHELETHIHGVKPTNRMIPLSEKMIEEKNVLKCLENSNYIPLKIIIEKNSLPSAISNKIMDILEQYERLSQLSKDAVDYIHGLLSYIDKNGGVPGTEAKKRAVYNLLDIFLFGDENDNRSVNDCSRSDTINATLADQDTEFESLLNKSLQFTCPKGIFPSIFDGLRVSQGRSSAGFFHSHANTPFAQKSDADNSKQGPQQSK